MTDGRERAIGGHNKPIAIRSLGCDAIGIAIHKFLATMVGNRESDFRGAQWIGRLLRLEGDALVGAHAFLLSMIGSNLPSNLMAGEL